MTNEAEQRFAEILRHWWSFDGRQHHTHSWHSREHFVEKILPEQLALYAKRSTAIAAMPEPWMLIDERAKAGPVLLGWFEFDASVGHWEDAYDAFGYLTEDFEFKVYDRQPIHWQPLPTRPSPQKDEQP